MFYWDFFTIIRKKSAYPIIRKRRTVQKREKEVIKFNSCCFLLEKHKNFPGHHYHRFPLLSTHKPWELPPSQGELSVCMCDTWWYCKMLCFIYFFAAFATTTFARCCHYSIKKKHEKKSSRKWLLLEHRARAHFFASTIFRRIYSRETAASDEEMAPQLNFLLLLAFMLPFPLERQNGIS